MKIFSLLVVALIVAALLGWLHALQVERAAGEPEAADAGPARVPPPRTTSVRAESDDDRPAPRVAAAEPGRPVPPLAMPGAPDDTLMWQPHRQDPLAMAAVGVSSLPAAGARGVEGDVSVLAGRPDRISPEAFWAPPPGRRGDAEGTSAETAPGADAARETLTPAELTAAGRKHLDHGRWEEALGAFVEAARTSDNDLTVVVQGMSALCDAKRYEEAFRMRDAYLEDGGGPAHGRYLAGMIHLAKGEIDAAKEEFEQARVANPTLSEVHFQLGKIAQEEGDLETAEKHLRNALFADPSFAETKFRLGVVLAAQGRHAEAETLYREILGRSPGDFATVQKLGAALFSQRRYAEALVCYQALRAVAPDDPDVINQISVTLKRLGRNQDALDYLVQGLELHPDNFVLRFNAACVLSEMNRGDDALAALDALRRTHPRDLVRFIDDPDFAGLRDTPEFQDIRRRLLAAVGASGDPATP